MSLNENRCLPNLCKTEKDLRGLKYWLTHKYYHQFPASDSKSTASDCAKPNHLTILGPAGWLCSAQAQMT